MKIQAWLKKRLPFNGVKNQVSTISKSVNLTNQKKAQGQTSSVVEPKD